MPGLVFSLDALNIRTLSACPVALPRAHGPAAPWVRAMTPECLGVLSTKEMEFMSKHYVLIYFISKANTEISGILH